MDRTRLVCVVFVRNGAVDIDREVDGEIVHRRDNETTQEIPALPSGDPYDPRELAARRAEIDAMLARARALARTVITRRR